MGITSWIGIVSNFFGFLLLLGLYLYSASRAFSRLGRAIKIEREKSAYKPADEQRILMLIRYGMKEQKYYLESNLNIERFSEQIGLSPKDVSYIINTQLKCNFLEFVNSHRVEEAKRILLLDESRVAIEVMYDAGFNSKSSFYRVFKNATGYSPNQYRLANNTGFLTDSESHENKPSKIQ